MYIKYALTCPYEYFYTYMFISHTYILMGVCGSTVVKVLGYKLEGHGFETR
jgi:hypothetical protein